MKRPILSSPSPLKITVGLLLACAPAISLFAMLLPNTAPTAALSVNDGNPVFVRIVGPATDRNHLEDIERILAQSPRSVRSVVSAEPPFTAAAPKAWCCQP